MDRANSALTCAAFPEGICNQQVHIVEGRCLPAGHRPLLASGPGAPDGKLLTSIWIMYCGGHSGRLFGAGRFTT
jgi:hypothetical protein